MTEQNTPLIALLDTSVCTKNLGDQIIMDAVNTQLRRIYPRSFFCSLPTHDYLSSESFKILEQSPFAIVGGTNLLTADMWKYNQWKVSYKDYFRLKNVILMGVGWWQYQKEPTFYTRTLLKRFLHGNMLHSVRDGYTQRKLQEMGLPNVVNTGCMTLWDLDAEHTSQIPQRKAENVIFTLTDYKPHPEKDKYLFNILAKQYNKVYLWLQGSRDLEYSKSICGTRAEIVDPTLKAFDEVLSSNLDLEYVGTRLHAGIRALQHKRRTMIVSVDNRATEMGRDFNLPVIERKDVGNLKTLLAEDRATVVNRPVEAIEAWKRQFSQPNGSAL
ncbi:MULTISPECIES: polysaccharide pyruvyl transferase family protein [unclassified Mesorhizobium]|uniref:polysaccharide pyruvyl transferase family protein n=1 Tax=unclassified Mesorhizobium TaxID=325217 RepID=UPI0030144D44